MRKLAVLGLAVILSISPCFAWGWWGKKNTSTQELEGKGYVGTLPNVTKNFTTSEPKDAKPIFQGSQEFNSANEIKPVPRDNPAFVNIIMKKEKTSEYINDINEIIPMLEKVYDLIENKENVQRFVASVYFLNQNCEYLRKKYLEKPESSYVSFQKLMEVSMHAKSDSLLKTEAEKYNPYLAYSAKRYIYNNNNINQQLEYLKTELEETIVVLKDAH